MSGEHRITLTLRPGATKNGDWVYRRKGVKASVYVNRRIFTRGTVPTSITLTSADGDVFRLPNNLNPEATAKRVEMLESRASRKQEIAEDILHEAKDLRSKAGELTATLDRFGQ
jgi:hypothetical protein